MAKVFFFISVISTVLLFGCKRSNHNFIEYNKIISDYHDAYFPKPLTEQSYKNPAIYIDFSSGMKVAFNDKTTIGFYELFINSLKLSKIDFYEVASNKVKKFENFDKSELYKIVKDKKKYNKINAPLDIAINQIVEKNQEAVFITDGELWQNEERDDPWAREAFEKWLKAGNTITFYVTDHVDARKQKHLFYMFFIPKNKCNTENTSSQFQYYLNNSSEAKLYNFKSFTFNNNGYNLTQEYPNETSGGANINAEIDSETFINKGLTKGFEYQEYLLNWEGIINYIRNSTDDNGNKIKGGEPLLSKLFIETPDFEFYTIDELDIKVYDLKKDIDKLALCRECRTNKPEFEQDESGERLLDEDNHPIVLSQGSEECYNEYGELKIDTIFNKNSKLTEVAELFVFDNEAFKNNIKEQNRGEVIIKINPNFNGTQISSEHQNIHRIDVILKSVSVNASNPHLDKFIWDGKQVDKNRSVYNSILGALNAVNPKGKVIYSYYVKTLPNDYMP